MDNLKALGRGTQITFIAAVLLLIVSFFRWQEIDLGVISGGQNAWHGFWGVVMGILTIILIARIAARLAAVEVPIPLSFATTSFVLGALIAICAVMKVLTDDYRNFWAFIGVALAIVVAVGAWLEVQEAGGIEHLRSQMPASAGSSAPAADAAAAPEPPSPPPPPAAAAPVPPSAAEPMTPMPEAPAPEAAAGAMDAAEDARSEAVDATGDEPSTGSGS